MQEKLIGSNVLGRLIQATLRLRHLEMERKPHTSGRALAGSCLIRTAAPFLDKKGVASIEFAILALPFFLLIMGIIEVGLVFWAGYELENATASAARLIRTGQAQTIGYTAEQLRAQLCQSVVIISDCKTKVQVSVQTFSSFAAITAPNAVDSKGKMQTTFPYTPGGPGAIVIFAAFYDWPLRTPLIGALLATLADGGCLLQSSVAFRNEPYS